MKHFILSIIAALFSITIAAQQFEVNGIYYSGNASNKRCSVIQSQESPYRGSINIPSTVTYNGVEYQVTGIAPHAFYKCEGLFSLILPNTVEILDDECFYGCKNLETFSIPSSVKSIGHCVFSGCDHLKELIIPESIENYYWCSIRLCGITKLVLPSTFPAYNKMLSVMYPNLHNFENYDGEYFRSCPNLECIEVSKDSKNYYSENGVLFNANMTTLLSYPRALAKKEYHYIIPESVQEIGESAFSKCSLLSIKLPSSITTILAGAFENINKLEYINIPSRCQDIRSTAFYNSKIDSIVIENGITNLNIPYLFFKPDFSYADFPESIISFGDVSFNKNATIIYRSRKPAPIRNFAFNNFYPYYFTTLHVLEGYKEEFENAEVWNKNCIIIDDIKYNKIEKIEFPKQEIVLPTGATSDIKYSVYPEDATFKNVTWENSNPEVVTLYDEVTGSFYCRQEGTAIITAKANDKSGIVAKLTIRVSDTGNSIHEIGDNSNKPIRTYSVNGQRLQHNVRGINIVVQEGGSIKKVIKK